MHAKKVDHDLTVSIKEKSKDIKSQSKGSLLWRQKWIWEESKKQDNDIKNRQNRLIGIHRRTCKRRKEWSWSRVCGQKDQKWPNRKIKISRLQQEIYVVLFKQKCSTRIRSKMTITTFPMEDSKNYHNYQIFKLQIHPKSNIWQINCFRKSAKSLQNRRNNR